MRADRLLSLLMLLQGRGKMKASELAEYLDVSERTVFRDIDALSAAGVPVYGEPGPDGGFALLDNYQTRLTGLTDEELRVLFMLSIPQPLVDLGLSPELKQALLKLSAALPDARRTLEDEFRLRFHLDSSGWEQHLEPMPNLQLVYQAVRQDRRLFIRYQPMFNVTLEKWVDPYGLVAKGGDWYLVSSSQGKMAVHRVAELLEARLGEDTFVRPSAFDVAVFWMDWCAQIAQTRQSYQVTVRIFPRLIPFLSQVIDSIRQEHVEDAAGEHEMVLDLRFASLEAARSWLLPLGSGLEVLAPLALRYSLQDYAEQILQVYSGKNSCPLLSKGLS
jgi:predicted DNA-binding transcriptional regulator YafY